MSVYVAAYRIPGADWQEFGRGGQFPMAQEARPTEKEARAAKVEFEPELPAGTLFKVYGPFADLKESLAATLRGETPQPTLPRTVGQLELATELGDLWVHAMGTWYGAQYLRTKRTGSHVVRYTSGTGKTREKTVRDDKLHIGLRPQHVRGRADTNDLPRAR